MLRRTKNYDNSQSTYYSGNAGNYMNQYGVGSNYNRNNGGYNSYSISNQYNAAYNNGMNNNQYGYNNGMNNNNNNNYGSNGSNNGNSSSSSSRSNDTVDLPV